MSNEAVLRFMEEHVGGLEIIMDQMVLPDMFDHEELTFRINIDGFKGYECFLPLLLMSSDDIVVKRVLKRVFLQLYCEKMEKDGEQALVKKVSDILGEEIKNHEAKIRRYRELEKQGIL